MTTRSCPSEQDIVGYVNGTIAEQVAEAIAEHVERCPPCEETLQEMEAMSDTVLGKLRQPVPHDAYLDEEAYRRAESLVEAIGLERSDLSLQSATDSHHETAPSELGHYRLLVKLGEGGDGSGLQGAAHQAEQSRGAQGVTDRPT